MFGGGGFVGGGLLALEGFEVREAGFAVLGCGFEGLGGRHCGRRAAFGVGVLFGLV